MINKTKICIIKLGALGDVVRTLPILPALKEKYPESEICWITKQDCLELFENNPYISKIFSLPYSNNEKFDSEKILSVRSDFLGAQKPENNLDLNSMVFDILFNFDIEKEATEIAEKIQSDKKYGFCSQDNFPAAFNPEAEYYLNTLFDDNLKKNNKKTYQEMMFQAACLDYKKQHCPIFLTEKDLQYAENFKIQNNLNTEKLIGIHIGASSRWPSKVWHEENLKEFIKQAKNKGYETLLFAGKNESEKQRKLIENLKSENIKICGNNPDNTKKQFASLINLCKTIVCSDSFALHVSLALKKPTIGLFFCTSPDEIEDYNLLTKLISKNLYDFFPERMDQYDERLVKSISAEEVLREIKND